VANGGDFAEYYTAAGNDYQWAFTTSVYNLTSPKLNAITALNAVSAGANYVWDNSAGQYLGLKYNNVFSRMGVSAITALEFIFTNQRWGCH